MTTAKFLTSPKVSFIVAALLPELGIGYKGQLPWNLKQEMKYFRRVTTATADPKKKNAVIMGRKTYYSIPPKFRPLKNRLNIVMTRNIGKLQEEMKEELAANEEILRLSNSLKHTLDSLTEADQIEEIFIIGGAEVYNQLMAQNHDLIDTIYLTEISHNDKLDMDAFFKLDTKLWKKSDQQELTNRLRLKGLHEEFQLTDNQQNEFTFHFTMWEKK